MSSESGREDGNSSGTEANLKESGIVIQEKEIFNMDGINKPEPLSLNGNLAENWRRFKRDYDLFMTATGRRTKTKAIQAATLLNLVGTEAVDLLETLKIEEAEKEDPEKIINTFKEYVEPQRNETYERFLFNSRKRQEGEPLEHYVAELKKMAKNCNYGQLEQSMIRDNIIYHMADTSLQQAILKNPDLQLEALIKQIKMHELSKKQTNELQGETMHKIEAVRKRDSHSQERTNYSNRRGVPGNYRREQSPGPYRARSMSRDRKTFYCKRCNSVHGPRQCPAYGRKCEKCLKYNHTRQACRTKHYRKDKSENKVSSDSDSEFSISSIKINNVQSDKTEEKSWYEKIQIQDYKVKCKIDTGADTNAFSLNLCCKLGLENKIKKKKIILETYGGHQIVAIGTVTTNCKYKGNNTELTFTVVSGEAETVLGLKTCRKLGIVNTVTEIKKSGQETEDFIQKNIDVFTGLGKFPGTYDIALKSDKKPVARPPRRIPKVIKDKLSVYLKELEEKGVVTACENPSAWISNIVIREKTDRSLRICLDPKHLNEAIQRPYYEIPTTEMIAEQLTGKKYFTILDLKDGFWQVKLSEKSSEYCTFSTPVGCYKFNRLPFGLNCAPEIFQRKNEEIFGHIPGTIIYFDDILVAGETLEEHDKSLARVIEAARRNNVKFNKGKVQYRKETVIYVGYKFSKEGKEIAKERIEAIKQLKNPKNKKELQRVLGIINYLREFIPNLASKTEHIRELLKDTVEWCWSSVHSNEFEKIKEEICKAPTLQTFDEKKEITIQTDASSTGLGCCLLQDKKPVAFASRSLTETEKNYAQIEKELISIVFAIRKFHYYVYGKKVNVHTDHKPLVTIFRKEIAKIGSPRLQRLRLKLIKYDLNVGYLAGKYMYIADTLSRDYLPHTNEDEIDLTQVIHTIYSKTAISERQIEKIKQGYNNDSTLRKVKEYCKTQWPESKKDVGKELEVYWKQKDDLHVVDDILFKEGRTVIPNELKAEMIQKLHEGHLGMTKMKLRARKLLYWPGMSKDIEKAAVSCEACRKYANKKIKETLIPHPPPQVPYEKIGSDIFEHGGKSYLVVVDYFSKWIDVVQLKSKTTNSVISQLKTIFATHGIPTHLIADNMPYSSFEMQNFADSWQFKIVTSSPRYPQSNGMAEKAVNIAKQIIRKCNEDKRDVELGLLAYRNTPVAGLKYTPAQMLMNREVRTTIPIMKKHLVPEVPMDAYKQQRIRRKEIKQNYDKGAKKSVSFKEGDRIYIYEKNIWKPGKIIRKWDTPRSYVVEDQTGRQLRRNTRHINRG